jgi:hypothetical protein
MQLVVIATGYCPDSGGVSIRVRNRGVKLATHL